MSWMGVGGVGTLSWMGMGCPVGIAGGKLVVADGGGNHVLLHHHDVHWDEVVLDGRDALGMVGCAPVLLKEESCLRLEDWVLHVSLDPLHPLNALLASEYLWHGSAGSHGLAHMEGTLFPSYEPVNDCIDHVRVVSSQVFRAVLCVFSKGGAVVLRQVARHYISTIVDQLPKAVHLVDALSAGDPILGGVGRVGLTHHT